MIFLLIGVILNLVQADTKPNFVLIMADQVRWDIIGAYGNQAVKTPNIDWIAANGLRFDRHYTSAPICTPARAVLLTG